MAYPRLEPLARLTLRVFCQWLSQGSVNTFDYTIASGTTLPPAEEVAAALEAAVASKYKHFMHTAAQFRGISIQQTNGAVVNQQLFSNALAGPGDGAPVPEAGQLCGLLSKQTERAGQQFRGRTYLPFPFKDPTDTLGKPTASQVALMTTIANQLLTTQFYTTASGVIALVPTIFHGFDSQEPPVKPPPSTITAAFAGTSWATQRRRGGYGQTNESPI
jgi:hypothetical protein